ncbi:MAG: iron-containing alcohol dehydrogenase [Sphaerochaetaceae bacterium]|nr:iron-containing alcohol dehydrogenase [Sphaerochaetaceae bacterium]
MEDIKPLLLGGGRVLKGAGCIRKIGKEASRFAKRVLCVAGDTSWALVKDNLKYSFDAANIEMVRYRFTGYCTEKTTDEIASVVKREHTALVIGIGGGKGLDAAKLGAMKAHTRVLTVPTSAATCAAYAPLSVLYDEKGAAMGPVFLRDEMAGVIIDTEIISRSPVRYLKAGIADAMAKEGEMYFSLSHMTEAEKMNLPSLGLHLAQMNNCKYLSTHPDDPEAVSDLIYTNIVMTGLVSCYAMGSKQLAVAHAFYDAFTHCYRTQRDTFLHGEIIACAIGVQLRVNGYDQKEIEKIADFFISLDLPVTLADLNIPLDRESIDLLISKIWEIAGVEDPLIRKRISDGVFTVRGQVD